MLVLARADNALPLDYGSLAVVGLGGECFARDPPVRPPFLLARQQRQGAGEEMKVAAGHLMNLNTSCRVLSVQEGDVDAVVEVVLVAGAEVAHVRRVHHKRERELA